jgi:hypothetical protein
MAVYKIFTEKDTTLYSDYNYMNTGLDPILELSKNISLNYPSQSSTGRILIQFPDTDIDFVKNTYITTSSYSAYLKMYLANSTGLPTDYTIETFPVYLPWDMGTGKFGDSPQTTNGASWVKRLAGRGYTIEVNATYDVNGYVLDDYYQSILEPVFVSSDWIISGSYPMGVTASFIPINPGGGNWYTASTATQSFGVYTEKDVCLDVTNIINEFTERVIPNNGFIIKTSGSLEFDPDYLYNLNYFSRDTNTIYPPVLEFRWDDSHYNVNGSIGTLVTSQDIRVSIANNKGEFNEKEIYRFRLNVRDQYPVRTFSTTSLYTSPKYLPISSYYSIKDVKSDTIVVDFDDNYTKISADSQGSYFDVYMNGLEPERYYKLLIKTIINGSTIVFDNEYFFKVLQ